MINGSFKSNRDSFICSYLFSFLVVVLFQESKTQGLSGSINGVAETYWGKNKGRSMEGALEKGTKILAALFIVLSVVLNLNW